MNFEVSSHWLLVIGYWLLGNKDCEKVDAGKRQVFDHIMEIQTLFLNFRIHSKILLCGN